MIQANQLRIGNLVGHQDSDYTSDEDEIHFTGRIAEIGERTVVVSDALTTGTRLAYQELISIPLTEEWLERMGFKKAEDSPGDDWYEINIGAFTLQVTILSEIVFCHITDFNGQSVLFRKFLGFRYVHQLQNMYFALAGQELNVKL